MATVQTKRKNLSVAEKDKLILEIENGKKESWSVSGIWFRKL